MISRRKFMAAALASVPVIVAGSELAELLAPRRTIFLPPRGGWFTQPIAYAGDSYVRYSGFERVIALPAAANAPIGALVTVANASEHPLQVVPAACSRMDWVHQGAYPIPPGYCAHFIRVKRSA